MMWLSASNIAAKPAGHAGSLDCDYLEDRKKRQLLGQLPQRREAGT